MIPRGKIHGWLIVITTIVIAFIYGYLAYFLFNRFQKIFPQENNTENRIVSCKDQKRDTILCICVAVLFILCTFVSGIG